MVGLEVDGQQGGALGFDILYQGDTAAFLAWFAPYVETLGVEVPVTDGYDAYGGVATELGMEHQLCLAMCERRWPGSAARFARRRPRRAATGTSWHS